MISTALEREVLEETGIEVEFESIISLGHFYPINFTNQIYMFYVQQFLKLQNKYTR